MVSDGDETEEIEDLRLIRRNEHFPMPKKKRRTKKNNFARVRSVQNMLVSGSNEKQSGILSPHWNGGASENDTDEKVENRGDLNKSRSSRGMKKPSSSSQRGRVKPEDHDSVFTGKSFYEYPGHYEETKKQINGIGTPSTKTAICCKN